MRPGRRVRMVLGSTLVLALATAASSCSSTSQQPSSPQPGASCQAGYVALTFDDGPGPTTRALLAALKSAGLRATFFDIGSRISRYPDSAQQTMAGGHAVEDHTWDHKSFTGATPHTKPLTTGQITHELGRTRDEIVSVLNRVPPFWRSPYGDTSASAQALAAGMGMTEVGWTVDSEDFKGVPVAQLVANVLTVRRGGVVVMHDSEKDVNTVAAISGIASGLRARGLCAGRLVESSKGTSGWKHGAFHARPARW